MARLEESQKRELCYLIAARMSTFKILEHFLEKHSLEVTPQQVYGYRNGVNTSEKWSKFIADSRTRYDAAVEECHFSSKRNRMNAIYKAYKVADKKKDAKGMILAVAQAHKEMEGTKIRLTDKDGEDFSFNINIGPPPEKAESKQVGPVLKLIPAEHAKGDTTGRD